MHPDYAGLAAYLDGALDPAAQAEVRAHVLTCAVCAARLERLRQDARQITLALGTVRPGRDLGAAVRARLGRPTLAAWLGRATALAGTVVALVLFAVLLASGRAASGMRLPDRLFVTDKAAGQLLVFDAADGALLGSSSLGDQPGAAAYDPLRNRVYVLLSQSVVALDPASLQPVERWLAARPFAANTQMALDAAKGRLYLIIGPSIAALDLDAPGLAVAETYDLGGTPSSLAVLPNGAAVFALDPTAARLWRITATGVTSDAITPALPSATLLRSGWLTPAADGQSLYALITEVSGDHRPGLWQLDLHGHELLSSRLDALPTPWDFALLGNGLLALPRGNGSVGGVELVDAQTLRTIARIDPQHDQHHIVAGPGGMLFGLNFTHNTVTRFDANTRSVVWSTPSLSGHQPWDGVFVPGGWRWPWEN